MIYRHKLDPSVRYEVRAADAGYYEVRRLDNQDAFGGRSFRVPAADWDAMYEPEPLEQGDES